MSLEKRLKINKDLKDMKLNEVHKLLKHKMRLLGHEENILYEIHHMYATLKKLDHPAYMGRIGKYLQ